MKFRRANRKNEIEIDPEDARMIMSDGYPSLDFFLSQVFCPACDGHTELVNYSIYLDDTNDIILDGQCKLCGRNVSRYVETGESLRSADIARHIRSIKRIAEGRHI